MPLEANPDKGIEINKGITDKILGGLFQLLLIILTVLVNAFKMMIVFGSVAISAFRKK